MKDKRWTKKEVKKLLESLDHFLETADVEDENHEDNVLRYLTNAFNRHRGMKTIRTKLLHLQSTHGDSSEADAFDNFLKKGSSSLGGFYDTLKEELELAERPIENATDHSMSGSEPPPNNSSLDIAEDRKLSSKSCLQTKPKTPLVSYSLSETFEQFMKRHEDIDSKALLSVLWEDGVRLQKDAKSSNAEAHGRHASNETLLVVDIKQNLREFMGKETHNEKLKAIRSQFGNLRDLRGRTNKVRTNDHIKTKFQVVAEQCAIIAGFHDFQYPAKDWLSRSSTDLKVLIDTATMSNRPRLTRSALRLDIENTIEVENLIVSLIGASIQEWIFKPSLKWSEASETAILRHYRDHIEALGGDEILRTIDSRAHKTLMDETSFEKTFVDRAAKRFSEKLITVLKPFIGRSEVEIDASDRPTSEIEMEVVDSDQESHSSDISMESERRAKHSTTLSERLHHVFWWAMKIKLESLCCEHIFDTIWPTPGAHVDRHRVNTDLGGENQSMPDSKRDEEVVVRLPLLPGIIWVKEKRRLGDFSNFGIGHLEELQQPEIICRAVVIEDSKID